MTLPGNPMAQVLVLWIVKWNITVPISLFVVDKLLKVDIPGNLLYSLTKDKTIKILLKPNQLHISYMLIAQLVASHKIMLLCKSNGPGLGWIHSKMACHSSHKIICV
jgi:hypothetical protein